MLTDEVSHKMVSVKQHMSSSLGNKLGFISAVGLLWSISCHLNKNRISVSVQVSLTRLSQGALRRCSSNTPDHPLSFMGAVVL